MRNKEILLGLLLSVAVAVWGTSSAGFAKGANSADQTNHGKGKIQSSQVHGKSSLAQGHSTSSSQTQSTTTGTSNSGGAHGPASPTFGGAAPVGNNGTTKI